MIVAGTYSFNEGEKIICKKYRSLLDEISHAISSVDSAQLRTKKSREKTMRGKMLFSPRKINAAFKEEFDRYGWQSVRVKCDYSTKFYATGYKNRDLNPGAFREMDFVKNQLGVEIQFGKYAFMVYNVCAKMTIFRNLGYIGCGVEIVPVKAFADDMSSGVSYFEQFIWDLETRGVSDIDIPVLIIGIDA